MATQRAGRGHDAVDALVRARGHHVDVNAACGPPLACLLGLGGLGDHHGDATATGERAGAGVEQRLGEHERHVMPELGKRSRAQHDDGSAAVPLGLVDLGLDERDHLVAGEGRLLSIPHAGDEDLLAGLGREVALDVRECEAVEGAVLHELEVERELGDEVAGHVRPGRLAHRDACDFRVLGHGSSS